MRSDTPQIPLIREHLLPRSAIAAAVAERAAQVTELLVKRRKIALAYRRTRSEARRIELAHLDHALARHNIDIPAIQRLTKRH